MVLRHLQCLLLELPSKNNPFFWICLAILIACLHFMLSRNTVLTYFEGASETDAYQLVDSKIRIITFCGGLCFHNSRSSRIFPSFNWPRCFYKLRLVRCCKIVNWFCRRRRRRRKIEGTKLFLKLFIVLYFSYIHMII